MSDRPKTHGGGWVVRDTPERRQRLTAALESHVMRRLRGLAGRMFGRELSTLVALDVQQLREIARRLRKSDPARRARVEQRGRL